MAIKAHEFDLNEKSMAKIERLLPRLKHSLLPSQIIKWLENFDSHEVDLAIDLLSVYEYIPFNEFMYRINDLLKNILDDIPSGEKILILPYGKIGKSATLVTYPLRNTPEYLKREADITLHHDYENVETPAQFGHLIFIDDFIGSGKTFCKEFSKKNRRGNSIEEWVTDNKIEKLYILATIIMVDGRKHIEGKYPGKIRIEADDRNKIFDRTHSPLRALGNLEGIEKLTKKYGGVIKVFGFPPYVAPFGYDESQSLISYFHSTPNNTLSIIWKKNSFWEALYPREAKIRMNEAREFKKEVAFYIGICNRLGIDIINGASIMKKKLYRGRIVDSNEREIKHNSKQDHSVISLLILKNQGYADLVICHILGLSMKELGDIYKEAKRIGFTDKLNNITIKGNQFLVELKKRTKKENFKEATEERLMPSNKLYIPKSFNGKT